MTARRTLALALAACSIGGGCNQAAPPPAASRATLPPGAVASVGGDLIASASVERIAQQQGVAPRAALELSLADALLAREARTSVPSGTTSNVERAALARGVLEQLASSAGARGPATPDELAAIVSERWPELDRPESVRTTQVVVLVKEPATEARAKALAQEIAVAVAATADADGFTKAAKSVPAGDLEVRVEALPWITADGRGLDKRDGTFLPRGAFDATFAKAANLLTTPGQLSPLVRTHYGFHVIRFEERLPAVQLPEAERARLLGPEALTRRAARERISLLEKLRKSARIEVDRASDDLTARLEVAP